MIHCSSCQEPYPEDQNPYRCPSCGGLFELGPAIPYQASVIDPTLPGIWRYRGSFGLPPGSPVVSLGEGHTPLLWSEVFGSQVGFKMETQNPTGSFKDRGTAVMVSFLRGRGVTFAVEDSSGNAGASFAAYAARSGIQARIFVPAYASGPKRRQISSYGAEVVPVSGPRSQAAATVREAAEGGAVYASHAYLPFGIAGFSTVAFELYEDLGELHGSVIVPVGHGSLLLGLHRGFKALKKAGVIADLPALIGVQASACAPLWRAFQEGSAGPAPVQEGKTRAEGVRIQEPHRGEAALAAVRDTGGRFVAVKETSVLEGQDRLGDIGYHVEPTSALVWDGLAQVVGDVPEPIIVILTGHGLKNP